MIQAAIQVVGTTAMLIILNWQLTIITLVCDAAIVLYARYSGARSKRFFAAQQASLGDLDGYVEEMVSGQKVIKVFNHEQRMSPASPAATTSFAAPAPPP